MELRLVNSLPSTLRITYGGFLYHRFNWKRDWREPHAVKQKVIDAHEASRKFSQFIKLKLDCVELDEQESLGALTWAMKNDVTYYDSVYVKASEKTGATLLTADDAFYEKVLQ